MKNIAVIALVVIIGYRVLSTLPAASPAAPSPTQLGWLQEHLQSLELKIRKIEALITLMQAERDSTMLVPASSEPLREYHVTPINQVRSQPTSQAPLISQQPQQPPPEIRETPTAPAPGMQPPPEPTKSVPVAIRVPAAGHYESRGLLGRRQVWIEDSPVTQQVQYRYTYQSRGGCSSGSCGSSSRGGVF